MTCFVGAPAVLFPADPGLVGAWRGLGAEGRHDGAAGAGDARPRRFRRRGCRPVDLRGSGLIPMRVDKWLWAVRVFKTRSQAGSACEGNAVRRLGQPLKPGSRLKPGDRLEVMRDGLLLELEVVALIEKRVGAAAAAAACRDHTPVERREEHAARMRELAQARRNRGAGRPSKRDRRQIGQVRKQMGWE